MPEFFFFSFFYTNKRELLLNIVINGAVELRSKSYAIFPHPSYVLDYYHSVWVLRCHLEREV